GLLFLLFGDDIARLLSGYDPDSPKASFVVESWLPVYRNLLLGIRIAGYSLIGFAILYLAQQIFSLVRYERYRVQTLENFFDQGAPATELRRIRLLMDRGLDTVGPRLASDYVEKRLMDRALDTVKPGSASLEVKLSKESRAIGP